MKFLVKNRPNLMKISSFWWGYHCFLEKGPSKTLIFSENDHF